MLKNLRRIGSMVDNLREALEKFKGCGLDVSRKTQRKTGPTKGLSWIAFL